MAKLSGDDKFEANAKTDATTHVTDTNINNKYVQNICPMCLKNFNTK